MIFKGKVHKYGDNVNTDEIIPARYLNTSDEAELAAHCMEDIDIDFPKNVQPGDIIVAGENFGCGSSREHAPLAIKASNVSCVIAQSFARIFFRNCINMGLPILESNFYQEIKSGDEIKIDLDTGIITRLRDNKKFKTEKFPEFMQNIINAGGLMSYVKNKI
ncbi:MAG: 3-isopropylmalate dehydratase small subunit [bacterium]|nr:3-isopropylmalate dehydratase small subunit [bacterium]